MKSYLTTFLFCFIGIIAGRAQNLVPNPSFENHIACPGNWATIERVGTATVTVNDWYRPSCGSPDYFNACATGNFGVPSNFFGYQKARTGDAYAGGYMMSASPSACREYLQAQLLATLTAGHEYYVNFWVNLSDWQPDALSAVNQIAAYFGPAYTDTLILPQLSYITPQIINAGNYISDTANWVKISGTFVANGTENWIVLGNFSTFAGQTSQVISGSTLTNNPYYFFDDICVIDMAPNTRTRDTSLCGLDGGTLRAPAGMQSYIWNTGDTTSSIFVNTTGTYWVKSFGDCEVWCDTIRVIKPVIPAIPGLDTVICTQPGTDIILPYTLPDLNWYFEPGGIGTSQQPRIDGSRPGQYLFYVSQSIGGCETELATVKVQLIDAPHLVPLPADTALCEGIPITLGRPMNDVSYQWNTGETGCCIQPGESGTYKLKVSNQCGSYETESEVTFYDCNRCVWAGNAFSPNGDGINDRFEVRTMCPLKKFKMRIYNRYGQQVFATDKIGEYWDGTFNGSPCDVSAYYYYLEAEPTQTGATKIKLKGDVTLTR